MKFGSYLTFNCNSLEQGKCTEEPWCPLGLNICCRDCEAPSGCVNCCSEVVDYIMLWEKKETTGDWLDTPFDYQLWEGKEPPQCPHCKEKLERVIRKEKTTAHDILKWDVKENEYILVSVQGSTSGYWFECIKCGKEITTIGIMQTLPFYRNKPQCYGNYFKMKSSLCKECEVESACDKKSFNSALDRM